MRNGKCCPQLVPSDTKSEEWRCVVGSLRCSGCARVYLFWILFTLSGVFSWPNQKINALRRLMVAGDGAVKCMAMAERTQIYQLSAAAWNGHRVWFVFALKRAKLFRIICRDAMWLLWACHQDGTCWSALKFLSTGKILLDHYVCLVLWTIGRSQFTCKSAVSVHKKYTFF